MPVSCDVLDVMSVFQLDAMTALNKKLVGLQRLAQLLEQLGDAAAAFVNDAHGFVDHLVPVAQIDFNVYIQIVSACPFLQLPPISAGASAGTAALQAMVSQAYDSMVNKLLNHPYSRMNKLQGQMDGYLAEVAAGAAIAAGFYQCLQAACNGTLFSGQGSAEVQAQAGQYHQNFVVGGGRVLNPAAQAKADRVTALLGSLQSLGATAGVPYAAAKSQLLSAQR